MQCSQNELLQYLSNASTAKGLNLRYLVIEGETTVADLIKIFNKVPEFNLEIHHLQFSNNQLDTLPEGLFQNLTTLREIILYGSQLTSLPENLFQNLTGLRKIVLDDGLLTSIPKGLFQGLINLESLSLRNNKLTELHEELFQGLTNLHFLFLDKNQLTTVHEGLFQGLINLRWLYLNNNQLTTLPKDLFQGLAALNKILLNDNQLTALPEGLFQKLTKLEAVTLQNNCLTALPTSLFQGSTRLKRLFLCNNLLTGFPENLLRELKDLTYIRLTTPPEYSFQEQPVSTYIHLSENQLTALSKNPMDLSGDQLAELSKNLIDLLGDWLTGRSKNPSDPSLAIKINLKDNFEFYLDDGYKIRVSDNLPKPSPEAIFKRIMAHPNIMVRLDMIQGALEQAESWGCVFSEEQKKVFKQQEKALMTEMVFTERYKLGLLWSSKQVLTKNNRDIQFDRNNVAMIMDMTLEGGGIPSRPKKRICLGLSGTN